MKRLLLALLLCLAVPSITSASLVWYANLNQNTGTTVTPQVGSQTCAFTNSPTWTTGKYNFGIDLDASTDDFLDCGTSHIVSTNDWTFAAWIKLESSAAHRPIFTSGDDDGAATSGMSMYITNLDKLECYVNVGTNSEEVATSTASVDETGAVWTHVACKKSGTALTTWINGAQDGSATLSSATMDYTGDGVVFRWGSWAVDAANLFLGQIDELCVFNSAEDVAALFARVPCQRAPIAPIILP